jgi:hypothetical protein
VSFEQAINRGQVLLFDVIDGKESS